jgi:hypothetical protein
LRNQIDFITPSFIVVTVILAASIVSASELGSSKHVYSAGTSTSAAAAPSITDPNQSSRIAVSGTLNAHNTKTDSIILAAGVANDASHQLLVQRAKRNAELTTKYSNHNVDVSGCKLLKSKVNASCYGLRDGFKGGPTLIGRFNPKFITAAYPDPRQQGNILIVRNPHTDIARAVTITDVGPSDQMQKKPYNRAIDLSSSAFDIFGLRCDKAGIMKDIEIYQCPMK